MKQNKKSMQRDARARAGIRTLWQAAAVAGSLVLAACGGGGSSGSGGTPTENAATQEYTPLHPAGTAPLETLQYREADGTLVTFMGARPTERHARERGEAWDAPDSGPGRYLTFPSFYFQHRTFGLEIRDEVPAGRQRIEVILHVNDGSFDGTTFSLFRNINNPEVRDFGWSLNYGFNNPEGKPLCHAGQRVCRMQFTSNWRTSPHSPLKVGDKIELAPAPRLKSPAIDGGGERYYSFEQLYVVGVGLRPWYGIAPNLDSEPLPEATLLGGQASVSYNYSEEPHRLFQQMANNIGIGNTQRFVEGRRLFHTSFADGTHSEHPKVNPVFTAHVGQLGPRFNQARCIECHTANGRSAPMQPGERLDTLSVFTGVVGAGGEVKPDPTYGWNIQQQAADPAAADHGVTLRSFESTRRTLSGGEQVELLKPVYDFRGPRPAAYSVRQAPQVIGLGLLEAVDETTVLALADPADRDGDGVRGIAQWVRDPETGRRLLGRFGWKATKASLRQQVGDALVQDMGVTSPVFPSRDCQRGGADCRRPQGPVAVSEQEVQRMSQYLSLIGVPAQRSLRSGYPEGIRVPPEHEVDPARITRGSALFAQARCTACHRPQLSTGKHHPLAELREQVIRPYTDLLLHDMGPGLADGLPQGQASGAMWRTPPLWGLGLLRHVQNGEQNVRYLHDGRARNLLEAILWHGGEAEGARMRFEAYSKDERDALLAFLGSL
ncbi:di-heme oxidoredictase family protein [Eleftheria terrae]|uniref:di-heme oxidoreductase family protein n=1 Tax=Eleftheria terrae TaxID=1597781 RepID=UPI00263B90B2|nr:di-heme oxidoredictase family protein [Eleftheria terrae]WKB55857.1 c-type cytochrome [Eleftheria terrae]